MTGNPWIDKYLGGGVIIILSLLLYLVFSLLLYSEMPTIFWFVSAFFVLFQSEHIYNFIGRSGFKVFGFLLGKIWHRFIACFTPAVVVVFTWWFASGL